MFERFLKRRYSVLLLVAAIGLILLLLFLWRDPLFYPMPFKRQINDQKITNYFTTLLTITGTILTTYFLRKQITISNAGFQPALYPERTQITMQEIVTDEIGNTQKLPMVIWNKEGGRFIKVFNLGNGIAKNTKFTWHYNVKEIIALMEGVYFYSENDLNNIESENKTSTYFIGKENFGLLYMPHFYLKCCGLKLIATKYDGTNFIRPSKRPSLRLQIDYQDIQHNIYSQSFDVSIWIIYPNITLDFIEQVH